MIDEQTKAAITPADEARAAKFLARSDGDFPELAGLFASHREDAAPPIAADLAADAVILIESLIKHLGVLDHGVLSDGRAITAKNVAAQLRALMIRSLADSLGVSDHIVESNGRIITASGILAKIGKA